MLSMFKGNKWYWSLILVPLTSFAYSIWLQANFGEAELKNVRNYLVLRCADKLNDTPKLECEKLQVKLLNIRGGLVFAGPTGKFQVTGDPSNPEKDRYLILTKPPWIGELVIRRAGNRSDYWLSF